jgi:glucose uptake protein GlcU
MSDEDPRPPVRTASQVVGLNLAVVFGYGVVFALFTREVLGLTSLVMLVHALALASSLRRAASCVREQPCRS